MNINNIENIFMLCAIAFTVFLNYKANKLEN